MSKKNDSNKIKPYKPKMPYTARNPYSNRRREEEAKRVKNEMINKGTWDEESYKNAKIVAWIVMLIISALIVWYKISEINSRYE